MLSWNTRGKRCISSDETLQMQNPPLLFFSHAVPSKAFWDTPKSNVWNQDRWTRKLLGHSVEFVCSEPTRDFPFGFHFTTLRLRLTWSFKEWILMQQMDLEWLILNCSLLYCTLDYIIFRNQLWCSDSTFFAWLSVAVLGDVDSQFLRIEMITLTLAKWDHPYIWFI